MVLLCKYPLFSIKKIFCGYKCTLVSKVRVNYAYVYMYDQLSDWIKNKGVNWFLVNKVTK